MVRAGLLALEFYTPETGAWRQAHMNARYISRFYSLLHMNFQRSSAFLSADEQFQQSRKLKDMYLLRDEIIAMF